LDVLMAQGLPIGVYRTSWGNRYFGQIRIRGQLYYLGTFDTIEEAAQVCAQAREALAIREEPAPEGAGSQEHGVHSMQGET
jgi:hypothetical protein